MSDLRSMARALGEGLFGKRKEETHSPQLDSLQQARLVIEGAPPLSSEITERAVSVFEKLIPWVRENFEQRACDVGEEKSAVLHSRLVSVPEIGVRFQQDLQDAFLWSRDVCSTMNKISGQVKDGRSMDMTLGELTYSVERFSASASATRKGMKDFLEIVKEIVPEGEALHTEAQAVLVLLGEQPVLVQKAEPTVAAIEPPKP